MTNWKYNGLLLSSYAGDNIDALNQLGEDGWELVGVDSGIAYMKRPSEKD